MDILPTQITDRDTAGVAAGTMDIAIVGMACRFPGANTLDEFWENLKLGIESIRFYSEQEVIESGVFPEIARQPNFVAAAGGIDHEFDFDAEFFELNPREAEIMDPQQRIALECAWETLESAGYAPGSYKGRIGVYAGASLNTYLLFNILPNRALLNSVGHFQVMTANDKDFLATRIAYKLNLEGPAISVQTACSTSLVAANLACQSLLNYQSDMALAGGVSITPKGRLYQDSFIFASDGRCRPFDADAQGTVGGNGVGFVLLKRLEDALADGDHIYTVIKGSAINNDGSLKVGYTAPSVSGQAAAILEAQAMAGVDPDTITYVEAHGTGTLLGDPIEIAALTQAFRTQTDRKQYCAIGSVKSNIGHLDTAAGISGLIKAALCVAHGQIAPSLNYAQPNPKLGITETPFFVNAELRDWDTGDVPRRAAVSSFGFGGTNAHAILEQAPDRVATARSDGPHLLVFSARNDAALKAAMTNMERHLRAHPSANLADVAYTLQVGRKAFRHRAYVVAAEAEDAATLLEAAKTKNPVQVAAPDGRAPVVFMFPGQGAQYVNMTRQLYETDKLYRQHLESCASLMRPYLDRDLLDVLFPPAGAEADAEALLSQTRYTQPALFAVEYALARLWQAWGIEPDAMIGHSVGEYVAACLAGVFSLQDAARLICLRGKLIQDQPGGAMLSVPLSEADATSRLRPGLSLAAVNAPSLCVISGDHPEIDRLEAELSAAQVTTRRLQVSHAFHSHMMQAAAEAFAALCATVTLAPPKLRFMSNLTGEWITDDQAMDPRYWADHLRHGVRFSAGLSRVLETAPAVLLEVGPSQVLTTLARQHRDAVAGIGLVNSIAPPMPRKPDGIQISNALGTLWAHGVAPNWMACGGGQPRRRVPLPTYAFQRKKYWLKPIYGDYGGHSDAEPMAAMPDPVATIDTRNGNRAAPGSDIEQTVAGVWEKMLGVNGIGVNDNFFSLGGHSLLATQLLAEIRQVTNTDVPLKLLFENPTIAGLSDQIRLLKAQNPEYAANAIPVISRDGHLPLSYHQEMVWNFERRFPGSSRFNGFISIRLTGPLNLDAMAFAVDEILRRHEVLRTNYRHHKGRSFAVIKPPAPMPVPVVDFRDMPEDVQNERILDLANTFVRRPFNLTKDVYIRPVLVKVKDDEHLLLLASHYIAVDNWTIGLVIQEFGSHYAAYGNSSAPRLPELPFQAVDYAAWQHEQYSDDVIAARLSYWRQHLQDVPEQQPVPLDRRRPLIPSLGGSTYHFRFDRELTDLVKDFSNREGSTVFMTLMAALNVLYSGYAASDEMVIGTIAGDRELGMESLVGAFVNVLALRTRLSGTHSFRDVQGSVRTVATDAYTHQLPFDIVVDRLGGDMLRHPYFRTMFILRHVPLSETQTGDLDVRLATLPIDRGTSDNDLSLYLQEKFGELVGYFEYKTDIFHRQTIEIVAADLLALTRRLVTEPDAPIQQAVADLSLATARGADTPSRGRMQQFLSFLRTPEAV